MQTLIIDLDGGHELLANSAAVRYLSHPTQLSQNHLPDIHLRPFSAHPASLRTGPTHIKRLQHELFEIQKTDAAWGLVIPLLDHVDYNVQFFGAHTSQIKIARDWYGLRPDFDVQGELDVSLYCL